MRKAVCALLFLVFCPFLIAQQALNNDSVIKMVKAGLTDDVIVATINATSGAYDTSPDGLIALKQAGVSDKVIAAIVAKGPGSAPDSTASSTPDASAPAAPLPPGVDNIGAYYKDSVGNFQPLPSEVVIFQSGGMVKHVASAGLVKEDLNGLVGGMRSRLVVGAPVTFILHVPQGTHRQRLRARSPSCRRQQSPVPIRRRRTHSRVLQLASRRDRFLQQANRPIRLPDCSQQRIGRRRVRFSCAAGYGLTNNPCQLRSDLHLRHRQLGGLVATGTRPLHFQAEPRAPVLGP